MDKKESFLRSINGGILRGAQTALAKKLGVSHVSVMRWLNGSQFPSEIYIRKMAKLVKCSEQEIEEIFSVILPSNHSPVRKANALKDSDTPFPDSSDAYFPLTAVVKKGEIIFFDDKDIPYPHNQRAPKQFSISVRDNFLAPDFRETDTLDAIAVNEVESGFDGKYFIVEIAKTQYLYRCRTTASSIHLSIGKTLKELPRKQIKILARVIALKKLL